MILRTLKNISIVLFCLAIPTLSHAEKDIKSATFVSKIYSQVVNFQFPLTWQLANREQVGNVFLLEFTPKNEDVTNWTNLLTIKAFKDAAATTDIKLMSKNDVKTFLNFCPNSVVYREIGEQKIAGYDANISITGCSVLPQASPFGGKKGMSELYLYTIIKGKKDVYMIFKAKRGKGFDMAKSSEQIDALIASMKQFLPIKIN